MSKNPLSHKQKNPSPLRTVLIVVALLIGFVVLKFGVGALNSRLINEVYLQIEDTSIKISPGEDEGLFMTPNISPNGNAVVFSGAVTGYARIWQYNHADGTTVALTSADYVAVEPSYSWDGTHIAFAADRGIDQSRTDMSKISNNPLLMNQMYLGGTPEVLNIYVMNADGSDLRQLTSGTGVDMRPTFSPDGQHVLFMSSRESGSLKELYLYTIPVTGDAAPRLIPNSVGAKRPWYSANGEWIYFWKEVDERDTLCRMAADGSTWHPLAADKEGEGSHGPFVDPSGEWLWFHSVHEKVYQIFKMPIEGGPVISVTPPGFERKTVAHATAARNGYYAFDVLGVTKKVSFLSGGGTQD